MPRKRRYDDAVYNRARRKLLKSLGLCSECKQKTSGGVRCSDCVDKRSGYLADRRRGFIAAGLCGRCGNAPPLATRVHCQACRDYYNEWAKKRRQLLREVQSG